MRSGAGGTDGRAEGRKTANEREEKDAAAAGGWNEEDEAENEATHGRPQPPRTRTRDEARLTEDRSIIDKAGRTG